MKRIGIGAMTVAAALFVAACGSSKSTTPPKKDGGKTDGGGVRLDGQPGTETIPPADGTVGDGKPVGDSGGTPVDPKVIGKPCTQGGGECGTGGTCLLVSQTKGGVCTTKCTPDDPQTDLINEDNCPGQPANSCGRIQDSAGKTQNFCFKSCQPKLGSNDCTAPFACSPRSAAFSGSLAKAVCLRFGCEADKDCPVTTGQICDTKVATSCPTGQECVPLSTTGNQGVCAEPGKCDKASGLCDKHATTKPTAKIGDPCKSDKECGEYMSCEMEIDRKTLFKEKDHGEACTTSNDCCGDCNTTTKKCEGSCAVHARNGYCVSSGCTFASSLKEFACGTGATCHKLFFGGICMKACALDKAADCRGNGGAGAGKDQYGDYECRNWSSLAIGGDSLADGPTCEFGDVAPCDLFANSTSLSCESLGAQNNTTDMACRKLDKSKTTDPKAAEGFCFDTTSSDQ